MLPSRPSEERTPEQVEEALSEIWAHAANEAAILARLRWLDPPSFPPLFAGSSEAFKELIEGAARHLGGPPAYYIVQEGEKAPAQDGYPQAALREMLAMYRRASKAVARAHMFGVAIKLSEAVGVNGKVGEWEPAVDLPLIRELFWEHAETAYIRLASYWDRVGQVLDFAFFNVRKFDQNGFDKVMQKISGNVVPMKPELNSAKSFVNLKAFSNSEKPDGFKWLVQRRNLIVHSLHLHELREQGDEVFESQFNHLTRSYRDKLKPASPVEESATLSSQLNKASDCFNGVISLVKSSPDRSVDQWVRRPQK